MKIRMNVSNLAETETLAKTFAEVLKVPTVVLLTGDLGAGKTTFVKSVVEALGCDQLVTSPTFALLNIYNAKFPIYHFDMYRLSSAEEARMVGFEQYFDKRTLDGVCFVEWPENVEGLFKDVDFVVNFNKIDETHREIEIKEGKCFLQ